MKINCCIDINNRLVPAGTMKKSGKPAKCQLAIGNKPGSIDKTIYLMVSTPQKPSGTMYKMYGNVETVFCKFIDQGKASIRVKEPQHDIVVSKADVNSLKGFLNVLKGVLRKGNVEESKDAEGISGNSTKVLSCLNPVTGKQLDKLKTKTIILERRNYPMHSGFAKSLEHLQISNCSLKRLDMRIPKLQNLRHLDLSDNCITSVPLELKELSSLSYLSLANNKVQDFSYQVCEALRRSLVTLDLCGNHHFTHFPMNLYSLKKLNTLKAHSCSINRLPSRIGELSSLRHINLSSNKLKTLPCSFLRLRLDELNLYRNEFVEPDEVKARLGVPTLGECAARSIKLNKVPVSEDDVYPDMWKYLCSVKWCPCGKPCFVTYVLYLASVDLRSMVKSTCHSLDNRGQTSAPMEAFLCSQHCLDLYQENPRRLRWK